MKKYQLNTIIQGDAINVRSLLLDESISCIVTSPPYWAKRDYKEKDKSIPDQLGQEPTVNLYIKHLVQIFDEVYHTLRKDGNLFVVIGDTRSRGTRGRKSNEIDTFSLNKTPIMPTMKPDYQQPDKSQCCIPELFKLSMALHGWIARSTYIWVKTNPKTESVKDRFTDCFEYVYHFVKQKRYYFDTQYEPATYNPEEGKLRQKRGVFVLSIQPFKGAHFATYPTWLIEPLIEAGCPKRICNKCGKVATPIYDHHVDLRERLNDTTEPCEEAGPSANNYAGLRRRLVGYNECDCRNGFHSGVVFDPFMGVGTTAVVADKLGFNWNGIELSKQYIKMAYKRIYNEKCVRKRG